MADGVDGARGPAELGLDDCFVVCFDHCFVEFLGARMRVAGCGVESVNLPDAE